MVTKKQTDEIQQYIKEIELDDRLAHAPRTKEQADGLLSIQNALIKYDSNAYTVLANHTSQINDPDRDLTSVLDKIQAIEDYLVKYYDDPLLFGSEIQTLHKLADKIQDLNHFTTDDFVKHIMKTIVSELTDLNFSENMIYKGTARNYALKSTFKSILTEN